MKYKVLLLLLLFLQGSLYVCCWCNGYSCWRKSALTSKQLDWKSPSIGQGPGILWDCLLKGHRKTLKEVWRREAFTDQTSDCSARLGKSWTLEPGYENFQVILERVFIAMSDCEPGQRVQGQNLSLIAKEKLSEDTTIQALVFPSWVHWKSVIS